MKARLVLLFLFAIVSISTSRRGSRRWWHFRYYRQSPSQNQTPCDSIKIDRDSQSLIERGYTKATEISGFRENPVLSFAFVNKPLKSFDIDDKCYTKAFYNEVGATKNGIIERGFGEILFKSNAPDMTTSAGKIWDSCAEYAEYLTRDDFERDSNACKQYALHFACVFREIKEQKLFNFACL